MSGMFDKLTGFAAYLFGVDISGGGLTGVWHTGRIVLSGLTATHDEATKTTTITGGAGGVGWGTTVTTTAATYAPTEAAVLAGLVIAAGRAGPQQIILPDITDNTPVLVEIHGFNSSISTTNVVNVVGTGIDTEIAFIDAQYDFLTFRWVKTHWVRL